MENKSIADQLDEIADLLELRDANPFRIRSYRNAAQSVRNLSDRLEDLAADDKDLSALPDIGESTAEKIHEMLKTGSCKRLKQLRKKMPRHLPDLLQVPKLGPNKARQLHEELDISTLNQLEKACEKHRVRELKGMGAKTEQNLIDGIRMLRKTEGRLLHVEAVEQLKPLGEYLDGIDSLEEWMPAGSYRRGRETIGDLDLLLRSSDRKDTVQHLVSYGAVDEVVDRGTEKTSIRLEDGLRVDFRFFDRDAFGAALLYFTGSRSHNIALRKAVRNKGWKLSEYGLFKGDSRLVGKTEKAVYHKLDMDWIPPELRENRGELEAAREGSLPHLVEPDDVHGDLHCHTKASDGKHSIRKMAEAAKEFGHDYIAITEHSQRVTMANGLNDDRVRRHADAIREVDADLKRFWLLAGIECDILKDGRLDLKEKTLAELDWVVASVHYDQELSRKAMTDRIVTAVSSGVVHCLGHPLGRMIGHREPMQMDLDRVFSACAEHGVFVEINAQPQRMDLPDIHCRQAKEAGVQFVISTDAHDTDGFRYITGGVQHARRGGLEKKDIVNTRSLTAFRKLMS